MDVIDAQGAIASEADIREALVKFVDQTKGDTPVISIASLTTQSRDFWGNARQELLPANEVAFHTIETAVLHCCLDLNQVHVLSLFHAELLNFSFFRLLPPPRVYKIAQRHDGTVRSVPAWREK